MSLAAVFTGSFLVALSGALAPGPLLAINIERTIRRGWKTGPLLITGHAMLEAGVVVLIVQGLSGVLLRPVVDNSLSLIGGILLCLMGGAMLFRGGQGRAEASAGSGRGSDVWYGVLGSLANPYWSIWWISIGMAYMALALPRGLPGVVAFFAGHISADFLWYSAVSISVARGKRRISGGLYRKGALACGLFLVFFGMWFVARGIGGFIGPAGIYF